MDWKREESLDGRFGNGAGKRGAGRAGTREGSDGGVDTWGCVMSKTLGAVERVRHYGQVWVFLVTLATLAGVVMAHGFWAVARLSGGLAVDWTVD